MSPKSLFIIVIKLIGLYFILKLLDYIPEFSKAIFQVFAMYEITSTGGGSLGMIFAPSTFLFFSVAFPILLVWICLFKSGWVVKKLRLDTGFSEENFALNMHRSTVLRIAIIITGLLVVFDTLPDLGKHFVIYLRASYNDIGPDHASALPLFLYYFFKFLIGLFLATASRLVVNIIELKRKKPAQ